MEKEYKFGAVNIAELASTLQEKLTEYGITKKSILTVCLDTDEFKKVDEDLFYRMNEDNEEKGEFIPSEGEIKVTFNNLEIDVIEERTEE